MPKVVDRDQRRAAVVDAVVRVAARDGLHKASLRTVAAEADLNLGSVRHYFAGQAELMRFAMAAIAERTSARVARRAAEEPRDAVAILAELLPLDAERRAENAVFAEFVVAARTDPELAELAAETARGTLALARRVVTARGVPDPEVEAQRLAALVDGLSLHHLLHPELTTAEDALAALEAHVDALRSGER